MSKSFLVIYPVKLSETFGHKEMETRIDFFRWLEIDMVLKILMCLHDPADLIRASVVSRYWRNFVISNGFCKQLCVRTFPQLASIACITEPISDSELAIDNPTGDAFEHDTFQREHRAYASLFRALTSFPPRFCIAYPVSASSTDNYPEESIINTLDPRDRILHRASYWSSTGYGDPDVPETLIYNLSANFCVITEINIAPFQALFQVGFPIYSSRFVRFRMGHPKSFSDIDHDFMESQESADDKFVWTYVSQTFPMVQENRLQRFKLPEPVLCIGGYLQIELLGRVQKQRTDGKYYICVAHVQAIGRQLSPAFSVEFSDPSNTVSLKYDAEEFKRTLQNASDGSDASLSTSLLPVQPPQDLVWGNLQDFVEMIQLQQNVMEFEWINNDFEMDDDDEVDPAFII